MNIENSPNSINVEKEAKKYAAKLHDEWRKSRNLIEGEALDGQPKREERWKPIDPENPNGQEVDIANTPFENLPPAWQKENLLSAEVAIKDIDALSSNERKIFDSEEAAARTHVDWKKRNTWAEGEQAGPYNELSTDEKNKDRKVIQEAVNSLKESGHDIKITNTSWANKENLEQEIARTKIELDAEENQEKRLEIENRIKKLSHELDVQTVRIHMDTPYGIHDKNLEGTEGAKPSPTEIGRYQEDRYGFLDGESIEDKNERKLES